MTRTQHALRLTAVALGTALVATQCRSPQWKVDAPIVGTPAASRRPDPGPQFTRKQLQTVATDAGSRSVDADARGADGAAHLLSAPAFVEHCHVYQLDAALPGHSVAVYDGARIWVRSTVPLPDAFEVKIWCRDDRLEAEPGSFSTVTVDNVDAAPETAEADAFLEAAATYLSTRTRHRRPQTRFDHFASARLRALKPRDNAALLLQQRRRRDRSDVADLMSLFTGIESVEEALQADRGLLLRSAAGDTLLDVTTVKRVDVPAHPWPQMIAELGKKPVMEPLAAAIPADVAYLHFADLRTFVKAARDVDTWGTTAALALESSGGVKHFTDRYEHELAVERTGLAERLGHLAAGSVAVLLGDPYVREGTDITLVFQVRNRTLLTGALGGFLASARQRDPSLKQESFEIGGFTVVRHFTSDLTVNRYQLEIGELLALSNSRPAIERLIAAHKGSLPRMSEAGDFQYMRTLYPYDGDEDGFLFLGDQFVARAVGPAQKINESRRMRAHADLLGVNHAALLYGWLEGRPPTSTEQLLSSGLLKSTDLVHGDGEAITFDPERGAASSWGTPARMQPLLDRKITSVSEREATAYRQFRARYQRNWSSYIDPIAARLRRSEDGDYDIDARMLPLIDGSEYNELRRYVGDTRMQAPPVGYAAQITVALADDARLRRWADDMAFSITGNEKLGVSWLGDWVMAGVGDRSGVWDVALSSEVVDSGVQVDHRDLERAIARAPIFIAAHVRSRLGLAAMLTALRAYSEQAGPGLISWQTGEPYRDVPVSQVRETTSPGTKRNPVILSYATVGDVFILSLDRPTLEEQIDAFLDRNPSAATDHQAVIAFRPDPDKSWLGQTLLGLMEEPSYANHMIALRQWEVLEQGRGRLPDSPADRRNLAMTWLGHEPVGVHHQVYNKQKDGLFGCAVYGTIPAPTLPSLPVANSPLTQLIDDIGGLQSSLSFEGEGNHLGLRARITWVRK